MSRTQAGIEYTVRFDAPSDPLPGVKVLERFAEDLRANMGEWALLGAAHSMGSAGQCAYMIRHGRQAGFSPAGSFEAESKTIFGEHRVYARFVGPDA